MKGSTLYTGIFLVPFLVSLGAGALWYKQAKTVISYEKIDLAHERPPLTSHVEVSGVVQEDRQITASGQTGRDRVYKFYAPVAPPNWNGQTPVTYFVTADDYTSKHDFGTYATVERGVLRKLSKFQVASFANIGVAVTANAAVIDTDNFSDVNIYIFTLILSVPFSMIAGFMALMACLSDMRDAARLKKIG
jgi:hypothetical protein